MIRGQIISGMIRIRARKSELQAESRSYRPKVGDTAQNPNRIAQKRAPNGVQVLLQKAPLKALLNPLKGCGFFAYSWKLPAYSGAFLLTVDNFSFSTYSWSFFAYSFSFFTYSWSFFAYSGKCV